MGQKNAKQGSLLDNRLSTGGNAFGEDSSTGYAVGGTYGPTDGTIGRRNNEPVV